MIRIEKADPGVKPFVTPPPGEQAVLDPLSAMHAGPMELYDKDAQQPEERQPAKTPYVTDLRLTVEQEERMLDYAFKRMAEVREEMGLESDNRVKTNGWMWIRERNLMSYEGDLLWRQAIGPVFQKSNLSLGTNLRHTRYLSARVQDDLLGTTPFFAALGRNQGKDLLAKQAEEYVQSVIDNSQVRDGLREAQRQALIANEAVVKTTWVVDAPVYKGKASVLVDEQGQPIRTPVKKLLIYENDDFRLDPNIQQPPQSDPSAPRDEAGNIIPMPDAPMAHSVILDKDPSFKMIEGQFRYAELPGLEHRLAIYDGPKVAPLHHTCFLCPLTKGSIHEADINVHLYTETPARMRKVYSDIDVGERYFSNPTGDEQPRWRLGENEEPKSSVLQQMEVAEVYMRYDADEDGEEEEVFLVLDTRERKPIFYDYLGNHFGKRPFEVIPGVEKVPHRWYGRGVFSLGEDQELHIDAEFNRAQLRGSESAQVLFRHPMSTEQWSGGMPVVLGGGQILDINGMYSPDNPPLFAVNLMPENKQCFELMEVSRQASDSVIGAISLKDASQSDLNQSKTATGIVNLQAASDVITKATEQEQTRGIEAIMHQVVELVLEHMDDTALMVSKNSGELVALNRDEIRSLEKDVKLTLTRSRSTQLQQVAATAITIGKDYLAVLQQDPVAARNLRPLYIQQLKSLEVNDADNICPEVTDEMIAKFQQAQQQQAMMAQQEQMAKAAPAPAEERKPIISYDEAPDPIKRQMEERDGYRPLTEGEAHDEYRRVQAEEDARRQREKEERAAAEHAS